MQPLALEEELRYRSAIRFIARLLPLPTPGTLPIPTPGTPGKVKSLHIVPYLPPVLSSQHVPLHLLSLRPLSTAALLLARTVLHTRVLRLRRESP